MEERWEACLLGLLRGYRVHACVSRITLLLLLEQITMILVV